MTEDRLRSHVLEALHDGPDGYRRLVREIVASRPDLTASALVAALSDAASEMDATVRRFGASTDEARMARRLAALLEVDAHRIRGADGHADATGGVDTVTMGALLAHWQDGDEFLLRL